MLSLLTSLQFSQVFFQVHQVSFFLVIALLIKGIDVLVLLVEFMLLSQSHSMKMTFLTLRCLLNPILHISLLSTSLVVHHMCCLIILRFLHLLLIYLLHLLNSHISSFANMSNTFTAVVTDTPMALTLLVSNALSDNTCSLVFLIL